MAKERRFNPHFRKIHSKETRNHPTYVYGKDEKEYKVVSLTTEEYTNNVKNVSLKKNPNPFSTDKAYMLPHPKKVSTKNKSRKLKGWKFAKEDMPSVKNVIKKERRER